MKRKASLLFSAFDHFVDCKRAQQMLTDYQHEITTSTKSNSYLYKPINTTQITATNTSPLLAAGAPLRQYVHLSETTREKVTNRTENELYTKVRINNFHRKLQKNTLVHTSFIIVLEKYYTISTIM